MGASDEPSVPFERHLAHQPGALIWTKWRGDLCCVVANDWQARWRTETVKLQLVSARGTVDRLDTSEDESLLRSDRLTREL